MDTKILVIIVVWILNFNLFYDRYHSCHGKKIKNDLEIASNNLEKCTSLKPANYSCANRCHDGYSRIRSCSCDVDCIKYNDCCFDYQQHCALNQTWSPESLNTFRDDFNNSNSGNPSWICTRDNVSVLFSCPSHWKDSLTRSKCEKIPDGLNYFASVPVYQRHSSNNYRNIYCAMCHGVDIQLLIFWRISLQCNITSDTKHLKLGQYIKNQCQVLYDMSNFIPPEPEVSRYCIGDINCKTDYPQRLNHNQTESARKCNQATAYVRVGDKIYSNPYCAMCNTNATKNDMACLDDAESIPIYPYEYLVFAVKPGTIIMLIDFTGTGDILYTRSNDRVFLFADQCSHGYLYDPVQMRCQKLDVNYNTNASDCFWNRAEFCNYTYGQLIHNCTTGQFLNSTYQYHFVNSTYIRLKENGNIYAIRAIYNSSQLSNETIISICRDKNEVIPLLKVIFNVVAFTGFALSIGAFIIIIVTYLLFHELRTRPGKCIMNLSITFLLLYIVLLVITFTPTHSKTRSMKNVCIAIASITHCLYLSCFAWMNVLTYDMYKTFNSFHVSKNSHEKGKFICYCIYGWLLPMIAVAILLALDITGVYYVGYAQAKAQCWIGNRSAVLYFIVIPIGAMTLVNCILYLITVVKIYQTRRKAAKLGSKHGDHVSECRLYLSMITVVGITWSLGIMANIPNLHFMYYPYLIMNNLQGIFMILAFVWNQRVYDKYRKLFLTIRQTTNSTDHSTIHPSRTLRA